MTRATGCRVVRWIPVANPLVGPALTLRTPPGSAAMPRGAPQLLPAMGRNDVEPYNSGSGASWDDLAGCNENPLRPLSRATRAMHGRLRIFQPAVSVSDPPTSRGGVEFSSEILNRFAAYLRFCIVGRCNHRETPFLK
jgi:hypothetical protein